MVQLFCTYSTQLVSRDNLLFLDPTFYETIIKYNLVNSWKQVYANSKIICLPVCVDLFWSLFILMFDETKLNIYQIKSIHDSNVPADMICSYFEKCGYQPEMYTTVVNLESNQDDSGLYVINNMILITRLFENEFSFSKFYNLEFRLLISRKDLIIFMKEIIFNLSFSEKAYLGKFVEASTGKRYVWPCRKIGISFAQLFNPNYNPNLVAVSYINHSDKDALCHWITENDLLSFNHIDMNQIVNKYIDTQKLFSEFEDTIYNIFNTK